MPNDLEPIITITYWEGDETRFKPFTQLTYIEWFESFGASPNRRFHAYADPSKFNHGADAGDITIRPTPTSWEHRGIPAHVRQALAALILKDPYNV